MLRLSPSLQLCSLRRRHDIIVSVCVREWLLLLLAMARTEHLDWVTLKSSILVLQTGESEGMGMACGMHRELLVRASGCFNSQQKAEGPAGTRGRGSRGSNSDSRQIIPAREP